MAERPTLESLQAMKFFTDISVDDLSKPADNSEKLHIRQREILFREYDNAGGSYLIAEGQVSLAICVPSVGCRRIMTLGPGEFLSWSPLFGQSRLTARGRAPSERPFATRVQLMDLGGAHLPEVALESD